MGELASDPEAGAINDLPYLAIKGGVYVGSSRDGLALYAMPPAAAIKTEHHEW